MTAATYPAGMYRDRKMSVIHLARIYPGFFVRSKKTPAFRARRLAAAPDISGIMSARAASPALLARPSWLSPR